MDSQTGVGCLFEMYIQAIIFMALGSVFSFCTAVAKRYITAYDFLLVLFRMNR